MNAVLETAHLSSVTNEERGADIRRRREGLGIISIRKFADAVGLNRATVTRAEEGTAAERTYSFLETWLDEHERKLGSPAGDLAQHEETPATAPSDHDTTSLVRIRMSGVFGIEDVTFEGPADQADEVRRLAVEFMREVRERGEND